MDDAVGFPRSFGRGLIEAHCTRRWAASRLSSFRDLLVAASLKPRPLGDPERSGLPAFRDLLVAASLKLGIAARPKVLVDDFPRSFGRGLIEATRDPSAAARSGSPFRDLLVAASLKQILCNQVGLPRQNFPRSFGRGLIEAQH